jgi:hypothetical protein
MPAYPEIADRVRQLAEDLIPYVRSKRMMLGLCLEPVVAWDYGLAHVCLTKLGYHDSRFDCGSSS